MQVSCLHVNVFRVIGTVKADSHIQCRSHAVPLPFPCRPAKGLNCVFPIDLHSAAVFDSHIPCHSHAVSLPCHEYLFLKATSLYHGRVVTGSWQSDGMKRHETCQRWAYSCYNAQFQEVCDPKRTNLRCGWPL
jgi:hypothetical protein